MDARLRVGYLWGELSVRKPLKPVQLDNYKPLREVVFETLREAIIKGDLSPGERLMEIQVAEELGVSRTPVREAIRKLELEGLVIMVPRKGAYVADISMRDLSDVFEVRCALEALAAELAADRATDEEIEELERMLVKISEALENNRIQETVELDTQFHEMLYAASRNERLRGILSQLREQIHRFRLQSWTRPGRARVALEEHRAIVEAVAERNPQLAKKRAMAHIRSAESVFIGNYISDAEQASHEEEE